MDPIQLSNSVSLICNKNKWCFNFSRSQSKVCWCCQKFQAVKGMYYNSILKHKCVKAVMLGKIKNHIPMRTITAISHRIPYKVIFHLPDSSNKDFHGL